MSLLKWWAKRRLRKHATYIRWLRIQVLAKEVMQEGIAIDDRYKVRCGWCNCEECACDMGRNRRLKAVRGDLQAIHTEYHLTLKNGVGVIDDLEARLNDS